MFYSSLIFFLGMGADGIMKDASKDVGIFMDS